MNRERARGDSNSISRAPELAPPPEGERAVMAELAKKGTKADTAFPVEPPPLIGWSLG